MPVARVGVIGGGQLARLMQAPAIGLGVDLVVLLEDPGSGAGPVVHHTILGSPDSEEAIRSLAAVSDVVTVDHEVLDLDLLRRLEHDGILIRPTSATLALAADKLAQKRFFEQAGIPVACFRPVTTIDDFDRAAADFRSVVLKMARTGYDGRGVWIRPDRSEAERVLAEGDELLVEQAVDTTVELAVVLTRSPSGEVVVYDPVQTIQQGGMCRAVLGPAPVTPHLDEAARTLARSVAEHLESIGTMAVEMFCVDDRLLVNEVAPRPHNSGHHTIDACVTSQFENHLRAVLALPLGDPSLRSPAAMVNLVGSGEGTDPRHRLARGLAADPGAKIHLYDKSPRPGRKIGHVTVCDDEADAALERAWQVVDVMGGEVAR
jgi:5-(carboxyamino)imidazole ribonucleotide synthase